MTAPFPGMEEFPTIPTLDLRRMAYSLARQDASYEDILVCSSRTENEPEIEEDLQYEEMNDVSEMKAEEQEIHDDSGYYEGLLPQAESINDTVLIRDFAFNGPEIQDSSVLQEATTATFRKVRASYHCLQDLAPGTNEKGVCEVNRSPTSECQTPEGSQRSDNSDGEMVITSDLPPAVPLSSKPVNTPGESGPAPIKQCDVQSSPLSSLDLYDEDGFLIEDEWSGDGWESLAATLWHRCHYTRVTKYGVREPLDKERTFEDFGEIPALIAPVEQSTVARQASTFSWKPRLKQSVELSSAMADAFNEHRDSIERNRGIRGIPGDFLEPHATMIERGLEAFDFLNRSTPEHDASNLPFGTVSQLESKSDQFMVHKQLRASEDLNIWQAYDRKLTFAMDLGGNAVPTASPEKSVQWSVDEVELASMSSTRTRSSRKDNHTVEHGNTIVVEQHEMFGEKTIDTKRDDKTEHARRESGWCWPWSRRHVLPSDTLSAGSAITVKRRTFWGCIPKSERRKLSKCPPALPVVGRRMSID